MINKTIPKAAAMMLLAIVIVSLLPVIAAFLVYWALSPETFWQRFGTLILAIVVVILILIGELIVLAAAVDYIEENRKLKKLVGREKDEFQD